MSDTSTVLPSISRAVRVRVSISHRAKREFCASLTNRKTGDMLAFASSAPADDCYVHIEDSGRNASLWIGGTAFGIPVKEANHAADLLGIRLVDQRTTPEAK